MNMQHGNEQKDSVSLVSRLKFPRDFFWGTSTSAYQVEGATQEDGRGRSIWDDFAATPGKTYEGATGEVAIDHYHRTAEDIDIMLQLGTNAYCFSVAWSRILPQGIGTVNKQGLDFYDRFIDALLEKGITPVLKLYHWDLPSALQERGGWFNRDTAYAFADYVDLLSVKYGDRVSYWITHNEPFCSSYLGHTIGLHAPGLTDAQIGIDAGHHVLLSHGLAVPIIRNNTLNRAKVGIALDYYPIYGVDDQPGTLEAVRQVDAFRNRWFFDPVFKGTYPPELFSCLDVRQPPIQDGDLSLISAPLDFLGLNYYSRWLVREWDEQKSGEKEHPNQIYEQIRNPEGSKFTGMNWEIYPQGLLKALQDIHREYAPPAILITENGAAFDDVLDGVAVHDQERTAYLQGHLESVSQAVEQGIPVEGYFSWSLMDNFEWSEGYRKRFGLVYVDYATQQRTIKDSGHWYASFTRSQR